MSRLRVRATVRAQTVAAACVVVLVALSGGGVVVVRVVRDQLVGAELTATRLRASDVLALAAAGDLPRRLSFPGEETAATQVLDSRGRVVASTENLEHDDVISSLRAEPGENESEVAVVDALDDDHRYVIVSSTSRGSGDFAVLSATSLESVDDAVSALIRALLVGIPLMVIVVGATTLILVGRALKPVAAITREVSDITGRGLDRRVPEPGTSDEIEELAVTMNGMLERLERSSARQRRFVADASHELRSPLASARTALEVAALHPDSREVLLSAIRDALVDHDRLDRITLDLLTLARLDDAQPVIADAVVDVDELIGLLLARRVEGDIEAEVHVGTQRVSEQVLTHVLTNLLDNAARYRTSRSRLSAGVVSGMLEIRIDDDGPGIPIGERQRIFERFTRLDEARVADEGTGLGLAIVRELVTAARGTVEVGDSPLGGASFVVRLPT